MMIESEWEDLQQTNTYCEVFTFFVNYFQLGLDEVSFFFNEVKLKVIGQKKTSRKEIVASQGFQ